MAESSNATDVSSPPNYTYHASHADLLAPMLDEVGNGVENLFEIPGHLRTTAVESGTEIPPELFRELQETSGYRLTEKQRAAVSLEPTSGIDKMFPRAMDQASVDVRRLWGEVADRTSAPMIVAHMADLLLSAKVRSGPAQAEATIDAYLALSRSRSSATLHVAEGLMRAATIARVYSLTSREASVRERMYVLAGDALRGSDPLAGIILRLLEALSIEPRTAPSTNPAPAEVEALLDQADAHFDGLFTVDAVANIALNLAKDNAGREAARRHQVESYIAIAEASAGAVKMLHLTSAAQLATRHHLPDLRDVAVRKMQSMKPEEMEWTVTETSIPISGRVVRGWVRPIEKSLGWRDGLAQWLTTPAPTGSYATNVAEVKMASKASGILRIVPTTVFGPHGLPQKSYGALGDDDREMLGTLEEQLAQYYGKLNWASLDRIREKFGKPEVHDVAAFIADFYSCDSTLAEVVAVAMDLFWEGHFTAACHLAYPAIEAGARAVLLALDEPLYRVELANSPGRFPALDFYLDSLRDHGFDVDWDRAVRSMLLSDGSNLRNLAAHGFRRFFSGAEAAVLIRLAAMFATISPPGSSEADRKTVDSYVRRPLRAARRKLKPRLGIVWR